MEEPNVLASATAVISRAQYQTVITSGSHAIIADEPQSVQGSDTGMTPNQLLLASLGSCKAITLQMYINRKMWVVEEVKIELHMYPADYGTRITSHISFKGNLSEEQKTRLVQIADKCPVHKILTGQVLIETTAI